MKFLSTVFTDHPASISETYLQHFGFALSFAISLAGAAFAALVHAFIPCLFEKTAGNIIRKLAIRMEQR